MKTMRRTTACSRWAARKTIAHLGDASRLIEQQTRSLPPVITCLEEAASLLDTGVTAAGVLKDGYNALIDNIIEQYVS